MEVNYKEVTLTLSHEEVWNLLYAMKRSLERSMAEHYSTLMNIQTFDEFNSTIRRQEALKLSILSSFSNLLDRPDIHDDFIELISRTWAEMEIKKVVREAEKISPPNFSDNDQAVLPKKDK